MLFSDSDQHFIYEGFTSLSVPSTVLYTHYFKEIMARPCHNYLINITAIPKDMAMGSGVFKTQSNIYDGALLQK